MTLPNQLTMGRLVLAVVSFPLLLDSSATVQDLGLLLFLLAGLTDWLDGYLARRMGLVSSFGRIADPFVDKILICGALIILLGAAEAAEVGLRPWMVVVIVSREFLVHGLRGFMEARGIPFGASTGGRSKMILQFSLVLGLFLLRTHGEILPLFFPAFLTGLLWVTLVLTIGSCTEYLYRAIRILKG
jgi:CDP-diacylglycerol--glycerol-3-phosphate 3-phosphatidyltransferase